MSSDDRKLTRGRAEEILSGDDVDFEQFVEIEDEAAEILKKNLTPSF
ncbi:hypothetical protein SH139x_005308 [Planctomycetaceae bacterium SH139]